MDPAVTAAFVAEGTRRAGVLWITVPGRQPRLVWPGWHNNAVYVVVGGLEQQVPGLVEADNVIIAVPSKDTGAALVSYPAAVGVVQPGTQEWTAVVPVLHAARLNAPDGEQQPERWARESVLVRLTPMVA